MRLSFGRCIIDTTSRELTVGGEARHLTQKVFQLLMVLLDERPRALSKAELHERLWPGIFVSESALSSLVAELRQAIGDSRQEATRLIRTVHGHGYAFGGQVTDVPASAAARPPAYRLLWGGREISLAEGTNLLGRVREALVWIDDPSVSRKHAILTVAGDEVTIRDLGSKNGTFVNRQRVDAARRLVDGDAISVGPATFTFRIYVEEGPTVTAFRR